MDTARAADADDVFHAENVVQLIGINADRRHAHSARHDGNAFALVIARIPVNAADVVHKLRIREIGLRDHFGAKRVARHEHGLCKIFRAARDVRREIGVFHSLQYLRDVLPQSPRSRGSAAQFFYLHYTG